MSRPFSGSVGVNNIVQNVTSSLFFYKLSNNNRDIVNVLGHKYA